MFVSGGPQTELHPAHQGVVTGVVVDAPSSRLDDHHPANEALNPPTRRVLVVGALHIVAFILFIVANDDIFFAPASGNGYALTLWRECRASATVLKNCTDSMDSAVLCPDFTRLITAMRALQIAAMALAVIGASVAVASFLGAEVVAVNIRVLNVTAATLTALVSAAAWSVQAAAWSQKVCPAWYDPISDIKSGGVEFYRLGALLPLTVVGTAVELAVVVVAVLPMQCLDMFVRDEDSRRRHAF